ncbi:MAG: histidinol dehydrogenase [Thaumarchaeota archaeon]|nr:histidinol dehydrogenase [Nitrososphaerota archaeon]
MKIITPRNFESFVDSVTPKLSKQDEKLVQSILVDVKKNGDLAIKRYEKKFGGTTLRSLRLSKKEIDDAYYQVSKKEIVAIKLVKSRLSRTENIIKNLLKNSKINIDGIKISKSFSPLRSVGCYVPGGLARYPSSAVMSIVPAKVVGVKRIIVVSPPNKKGELDPLTIVASNICGATEIYKIGGAQAIAALSFGTKTIQKVDKIVGPGGPFVTLAKSLISNTTSIDMLAGPTELGIIADNSADSNFIADDLITQAEHSSESFCFLITTSSKLAKLVNKSIVKKIKKSKRSNIIKKSLKKNGFIAVCKSNTDVIKLANKLAPEHLQIISKNQNKIAEKITTSGIILIGKYTPSSASDYLFGSNHILPTNKFGRVRGSLSVLDFVKLGTKIESSKSSLQKLSKYLKVLTTAEDLPNHYESVRSRLE